MQDLSDDKHEKKDAETTQTYKLKRRRILNEVTCCRVRETRRGALSLSQQIQNPMP